MKRACSATRGIFLRKTMFYKNIFWMLLNLG